MLLPFALFRAWTADSWLPSSSRHCPALDQPTVSSNSGHCFLDVHRVTYLLWDVGEDHWHDLAARRVLRVSPLQPGHVGHGALHQPLQPVYLGVLGGVGRVGHGELDQVRLLTLRARGGGGCADLWPRGGRGPGTWPPGGGRGLSCLGLWLLCGWPGLLSGSGICKDKSVRWHEIECVTPWSSLSSLCNLVSWAADEHQTLNGFWRIIEPIRA